MREGKKEALQCWLCSACIFTFFSSHFEMKICIIELIAFTIKKKKKKKHPLSPFQTHIILHFYLLSRYISFHFDRFFYTNQTKPVLTE